MRPIYLSIAEHPACASKSEVSLDGVPVEWCVAGHEGEGWVDCHVVDEHGQLIAPVSDDQPWPVVRRTGRVEFHPKPGVTREELEQIADQLDMVRLAGFGPDSTVYVSSEKLVCREAMALVRRLNALLPEVRVWVSANDEA